MKIVSLFYDDDKSVVVTASFDASVRLVVGCLKN